jgi:hypothetical protein
VVAADATTATVPGAFTFTAAGAATASKKKR